MIVAGDRSRCSGSCGRSCCGGPRRRALSGIGESIGRWGPATSYGGRTEGEPCPTGIGDMCGDVDVSAWAYTAKYWLEKAIWLREMNAVAYGSDMSTWPLVSRAAIVAMAAAKETLNGDLGFLDGAKVDTLIKVQKALKLVCEGLAVGVEQSGLTKIPPDYDPSEDSKVVVTPPTWPNPFSALGDWGMGMLLPVGIGIAALLLLTRGK